MNVNKKLSEYIKKNQKTIIFAGIFAVINLLELVIMYIYFNANNEPTVEFNTSIGIITGAIIAMIIGYFSSIQMGRNKNFLKEIRKIIVRQEIKTSKLEADKREYVHNLIETLLQRSFTACRYFKLAWKYQGKTLDVTPHQLNQQANHEIQIIMNVHEEEIYNYYSVNSSYLSFQISEYIKNLHNTNNLFKNHFKNKFTNAKMMQLWNSYLMFFGFLLADEKIRRHHDIKYYESELRKYILLNDSPFLIITCGLDKHWDLENLMEIPVKFWCNRCEKKIDFDIVEVERNYPFKKYNISDLVCTDCGTNSLSSISKNNP